MALECCKAKLPDALCTACYIGPQNVHPSSLRLCFVFKACACWMIKKHLASVPCTLGRTAAVTQTWIWIWSFFKKLFESRSHGDYEPQFTGLWSWLLSWNFIVNWNSPSQDATHLDDRNLLTYGKSLTVGKLELG